MYFKGKKMIKFVEERRKLETWCFHFSWCFLFAGMLFSVLGGSGTVILHFSCIMSYLTTVVFRRFSDKMAKISIAILCLGEIALCGFSFWMKTDVLYIPSSFVIFVFMLVGILFGKELF